MQKVNVLNIVVSHLNSLRDDDGRFLWSDILMFFGVPLLASIAFYLCGGTISKDALGQSITAFSIFAALLLSVQVALYNVSLRPISAPDDPRKKKKFDEVNLTRFALMKDLNDNVSYLILLSVCFVTLFLAAYVLEWKGEFASAAGFALYTHFFLTLLMVVKRASIVFSRAYETQLPNG
ncbi:MULTISPECIES: hypothetical protein [unclassified Bradyrhizobium]|uniref:hypothetical protein n=1 Tax=unclassified Bradyrhizobium TaxID=2631580 RepID=UPI002915D741|nr:MULTISPECIES: hypothetical protein [unclassified Bradyrhizobium]